MQRSVLLQLLGLPRDESENINNSDLYDITIDWDSVVNRLKHHPEEGRAFKESQFGTLSFPLRIAVKNKKSPLTVEAATAFLEANSDALDSCTFCDACRNRYTSVDIIKLFLSKNAGLVSDPVKVSSCCNLLPIHMAAIQGNEGVIRELVRVYPLGLSHAGNGDLPLAYACLYNHQSLDVIQFLLEEGIKYNVGGTDAVGGLLCGYPHSLLHLVASKYRICYSNMLQKDQQKLWAKTKLCIQFAATTCRIPEQICNNHTNVPITFAAIDMALELTQSSSKLKLRKLVHGEFVEPMDSNEFLGFVFTAIKRHEKKSLTIRNERGLLPLQYAVERGFKNETGIQHIIDADPTILTNDTSLIEGNLLPNVLSKVGNSNLSNLFDVIQTLPPHCIREIDECEKGKWKFHNRIRTLTSCAWKPLFLSS